MIKTLFSIFLILHGMVHLLYLGQSRRFFELQPGLAWPDGSWAFVRWVGNDALRWLASLALALAAFGFVAGGLGLLLTQPWWQPVVIGAVVLPTLLYVLFWDGTGQRLPDQGAIGILLNLALAVVILILPRFGFAL